MGRPSESVLTLLPQRASAMLFFLSSATEWQLNLIGPSNFLLKQRTCVCTDALVNICVRACTIETICSQWASMSHRSDLSHGIWGIHSPLCTSPFMHHSFFLSHSTLLAPPPLILNHRVLCLSLHLPSALCLPSVVRSVSLSFIRFPWLFHLSHKLRKDNIEGALITRGLFLWLSFHHSVGVAQRHRLHQTPAGFYQLLYVTEYANQRGIHNIFLQFVTCTGACSSVHMHTYPRNTLGDTSN